ncbi:MAG: AI-2E family transporter [Actinobacteria bacterium]|nr:AI-2E family transporter [Actinomycetota bacterium]MCB8997965.1 AI-2E family transporter [Actinomycetota bacterium]MCB9414438.1 AI-2E family transporter [Actinomycetota bacterium]MCB9424723.1 AI-2E family transporter [Actinomycetota bacterium]HRY08698.1 AI-2E family transporter [Candidatus Nanopelagicales bacterium]
MDDNGKPTPEAAFGDALPERPDMAPPPPVAEAPDWIMPMVRKIIWRVVIVLLVTALLIVMALKARNLLSMLFIAGFFGIAMEPAVNHLHMKRGMKRGAATGLVFVVSATFLLVLVFVMIPGLVAVAGELSNSLKGAIPKINDQFGTTFPTSKTDPAFATAEENVKNWLQDHATDLMGFAGNTIGLMFQFFTIAMFAFYFAADAPQIRRAILRKFAPEQQQRLGWAWDTAIEQTGGYLYSRLLLMVINGGLFFFVMLLVGVSWTIALPMAIFEGFVAEFIPAVGTYIGAAVPILFTLVIQGLTAAVILLIWTLIYQQLENYFLSPKISAKTMEINGGVAFGAAIAGGAIGGPMLAFMSLPIAALITSFVKNFSRRYPLTYFSPYDGDYTEKDEDAAIEANPHVVREVPQD